MYRINLVIFMIIVLTMFLPNYSFSHNDDPRHMAMVTLGKNMKEISRINRSGDSFGPSDLKKLNEIYEISKNFNILFANDDSGKESSRASPQIWINKSKFISFSKDFEMSIANLIKSVNNKNNLEISDAISKVGANCGKCHRTFRLPKKN